MDRVIIGLHGLNNKASASVLRDWWILSIRNGLRAVSHPNIPFDFKLLYWSDLLYPSSLDIHITSKDDPRFLNNPYKKLAPQIVPTFPKWKQRRLERLEKVTNGLLHNERIFNTVENLSDHLIHSRFHDLDAYFTNKTGYRDAKHRPIRDVILERLANLLQQYQDKHVMIVAHSMGSIIAFDLLSQPKVPFVVNTLLTVGSPLGQPTLLCKFNPENPVTHKTVTPPGVRKWYNIADIDDIISLDPTLGDDFAPNDMGVKPIDIIVNNAYCWEKIANPHAIYGYLQTPECAELIYRFLTKGMSRLKCRFTKTWGWIQESWLNDSKKRLNRSPSRQERLSEDKDRHLSNENKFDVQAKS